LTEVTLTVLSCQTELTLSIALVRKVILLLTVFSLACPVAEDVALAKAVAQPAGLVKWECTKQLWVGAYVPGWNQGELDPKHHRALDAVTDFMHFAVYFRPDDGSLDLKINELFAARMKALVIAAHKQGRQALLVVGGEGAAPSLRIAASPGRLQQTFRSIFFLVSRYGYDTPRS